MSAHTHQLHHGESLLEAAQSRLEDKGEQWTEMRSNVFETLAGFDRPASAYDIAEAVSKSQGRRVAAKAPTLMSPTSTRIACTTASS